MKRNETHRAAMRHQVFPNNVW